MFNYTSQGAFKKVTIYNNYVFKEARTREDEEYYDSSYSEFSNENSVDEESSFEEMYKEYFFSKTFSHLPVILPILWGDYLGFAVSRAVLEEDLDERVKSQSLKPLIVKKVISKLKKLGYQNSVRIARSSRVGDLIDFGLTAKLPISNIINDIFWLLYLNEKRDIMDDMHSKNYGTYKGHIVAIDTGQTNSRSKKRYALDKNISVVYNWDRETSKTIETKKRNIGYYRSLYTGVDLDPEWHQLYLFLLRAKHEKKPVELSYSHGETVILDKIRVCNNGFRLHYNKKHRVSIYHLSDVRNFDKNAKV